MSWRAQATCSNPSAVRYSPADAMLRLVSVEILVPCVVRPSRKVRPGDLVATETAQLQTLNR